jgi:hypothetical protein
VTHRETPITPIDHHYTITFQVNPDNQVVAQLRRVMRTGHSSLIFAGGPVPTKAEAEALVGIFLKASCPTCHDAKQVMARPEAQSDDYDKGTETCPECSAKVTITYRIIQTDETRSLSVTQDKIIARGGRLFVEVWSGHYAELELAQPHFGWAVYPD